jgi:hypothetical protein
MKQLAIALPFVLLAAACGGGGTDGITSVPGRGAIAMQIVPNPIVATHVSGDTYDFPFEVVVRETGGRPVTITRITVNVNGPLGLNLHQEEWDAARIRSLGYDPTLGANQEVRYRFSPRKEVPDDRLFSSVNAELRVDAVDDGGSATSATTTVTVRR